MKQTHHATFVRFRSTNGSLLVHKKLRPSLVRDAKKADITLTDVVVEILSERYGGSYEPTGRTYSWTKPSPQHDIMNIRLPLALWKKLRRAGENSGRGDIGEIRYALCDHYGLKIPA